MTVSELLWSQARSHDGDLQWLVRQVLGVQVSNTERYTLHQQATALVIHPVDDLAAQDMPRNAQGYLNHWNAARRDLQVDALLAYEPCDFPAQLWAPNAPTGFLPYWLYSTLLGMEDNRIEYLNVRNTMIQDFIPFLQQALRITRVMRFPSDPALDAFHRARYLVLRFYMDAVLHAV